jgi:hypothetical protein
VAIRGPFLVFQARDFLPSNYTNEREFHRLFTKNRKTYLTYSTLRLNKKVIGSRGFPRRNAVCSVNTAILNGLITVFDPAVLTAFDFVVELKKSAN